MTIDVSKVTLRDTMLTADALAHFGTPAAIADLLGISRQAVSLWRRKELVPPLSAARLADLSNGALTFDPSLYEHWNRREKQ